MTQEVQPLTWQKRTNLEEHQQFFSKINEIIANLAPTVDEAEAAIAQATAAIASANDAIATANAASAAASAAASQAQTAASTVAGYNTRLTAAEGGIDAAEGDIAALQGRMGTAEGNITSLGTRMSAAETKNSQQDTAIAALQTADGQNVKISRINEYAVGLTGNQLNIAGTKGFIGPGQPMIELAAYPIWQMKETTVGFDEVGITAAGMNFYRKGTYSGRFSETTEADGSVTIDLMIKSNNTEANKEGRLQIYEKTDHTFGMRFWNGSGWTNLVA